MSFMKWSITIVACLLVLGALAAFKVMDIRASIAFAQAYPEPSETVEQAVVATAEYSPAITVIGELVAPQRLDLRNEISGEIVAVNFQSGGTIEKGQLLLQLDTAVEEANLDVARARADLAEQVYARNLELFESKVSNADALDRAKAEMAAATAEIRVLERTIAKKTLRAPFDGRAGLHNFEIGQFLPSNTLVSSLIGNSEQIWVDFQVPQFYPQLSVDTDVAISAISNEQSAKAVTAKIIAENTVLNADNRSRTYRASLPNPQGQYAPHTMVKLQVPIGAPVQLLQVPAQAVQSDPLGQYVFVLRDDPASRGKRAARQQVAVKIIEADKALLEPGSGLLQGDSIAAAGAFKLYEGILVFTGARESSFPAAESTGSAGRESR